MTDMRVTCCVAGGGPAGMMAGYLLARAGIDVLVLEKHADFLRDFRGDTIHPSTLELMFELGLLPEFLALPHQEVTQVGADIGGTFVHIADFSHLPTRCRFLAFMPQWDFLDFLARQGRRYPGFRLMMNADVEDLIIEGDRVIGLTARTPEGPLRVRADLVIAADGRHSDVRRLAGLEVENLGAPMDVLWFKLQRRTDDPAEALGHIKAGHMLVLLNRGAEWQCAFVIPKGSLEKVREAGLPAFRASVADLSGFLGERTEEIRSWDDVKLLTVTVDRLNTWYRAGLLCIGDAAHAMSPIGGVGINLAIQDAVATANILAEALRDGRVGEDDLKRVQERRMWPTKVTQGIQILVQNNIISRVLDDTQPIEAPFALRVLNLVPQLRRIPARVMGVGVRPEHVRTPDILAEA
jgi:2-polyprenyl-6-methoxyphenol hydroxylase-like FAD-dependent oxidoreductase